MAKKIVGIDQAASAGRQGEPVAADRPGAWVSAGSTSWSSARRSTPQTQNLEPGMPIPVVITAYGDRSFTFVTKTPPNSYFLKKAAGIEKGSQTTGKGATVGRVTMAQIREIAEKKMAGPQCQRSRRRRAG